MSKEIELGELEFKAEDFSSYATARDTAEKANRILREKLAKAPEVFGNVRWDDRPNGTKRARLVCIEEVGK